MMFFVTFNWGENALQIDPLDREAKDAWEPDVLPWLAEIFPRYQAAAFGKRELMAFGAELRNHLRQRFPRAELQIDVLWKDPPLPQPDFERKVFR